MPACSPRRVHCCLGALLLLVQCLSSAHSALGQSEASVVSETSFQGLLSVPGALASLDPVLYKTWLAAKASAAATSSAPAACPVGVSCQRNATLASGNSTISLFSTPTYHLVAAFSSSDVALSTPVTNSSTFQSIPYADVIVTGNKAAQPHAATLDAFITGVGNDSNLSMAGVVKNWNLTINNGTPVNVMVTGVGTGATLAPLAAMYFAATYPMAHITLITFGAPTWPLNNMANWTLTQLIDLYYLYPATLDKYPVLKRSSIAEVSALRSPFLGLGVAQWNLATQVLELLKDSQTVQIIADNGTDLTALNAPPPPAAENETAAFDNSDADYSPARLNETIAMWNSVKDECPPIFCKIRFPSVLQALIYEEYYPETPDVHGPVRIGEVFDEYGPSDLVLTAGKDADGMVGWIPSRETAYFVYRGSESKRDWIADANVKLSPYNTSSPAQAAVFRDPQVHAGVFNQFEELSFKANNDSVDFESVLKNISGGATPRVIVCTGQSLGGGLSHMCGPWASNTWPTASVFVVNEGSLKPGDAHFMDYFNIVVGNAYRMVNGKDQVPLLFPTPNYQQVFRGWWLDNSTSAGPVLIAKERDPLKVKEANWVDHSYYTYSLLQMGIDKVTAPDWVLELGDASVDQAGSTSGPPPPPNKGQGRSNPHMGWVSLCYWVLAALLVHIIIC